MRALTPFSDSPSDSPERCHTELVTEDTHSVWVTSERGEKSRLVLTGSAGYLGLVLDPLSFLTGERSAIMESVSSCLSGLFSVSGAGPEGRTASGSVSAHTVQLCCTALKWVRFGFVYAFQSVAFHNHHHHLFYLLVFLTEDGSGYRRIPREFSGIFQVT